MASNTVTRKSLVEAIRHEVGLPESECAELLGGVLELVTDRLAEGKPVKISKFGSFSVRHKRERIGRNPKTGVEVPIAPRRVIVFRASQALKDRLNHPE